MDLLFELGFYISFLLKCIVSLLFGGLIGYERAARKKPAGVKTHALICLGATILTFLSLNFSDYTDPSRIAAQIVSGIGFIGAGTIFVSRERIQGLTSAATVWVCAAVGMLIGAGYILLAFISIITMIGLFKLMKPKYTPDTETHSMTIEMHSWKAIRSITEMVRAFGITIHSKSIQKDDKIYLKLDYSATSVVDHFFLKRVCRLKGVGKVYRV